MSSQAPVIEGVKLVKQFELSKSWVSRRRPRVHAVTDVDIAVHKQRTVGLVGESGSGKSTLGRVLLGLTPPTSGEVRCDGEPMSGLPRQSRAEQRRKLQMVFQNPTGSFDPQSSVLNSLREPFNAHRGLRNGGTVETQIADMVARVGMSSVDLHRYPRQFSGGQLQRLAIARALLCQPELIVCDEAVSSLDVSTQARIVNLLVELQQQTGVALLFISHDLSLVRHLSDEIAVMYLGQIVEIGPGSVVGGAPRHPYTKALLSASPVPDPAAMRARSRIEVLGEPPSPLNPPTGCRFHTRCPMVMPVCSVDDPAPRTMPDGVTVRCHLFGEPSTNGHPSGQAVADPAQSNPTTMQL